MTTGSVIRDQNRIHIWWGVSSVDGVTLTPIQVNSSTGRVEMEIGTSIMPVMSAPPANIPREENRIPCLAAQSNASSSVFIPVSVDPSTGAIQAQTA